MSTKIVALAGIAPDTYSPLCKDIKGSTPQTRNDHFDTSSRRPLADVLLQRGCFRTFHARPPGFVDIGRRPLPADCGTDRRESKPACSTPAPGGECRARGGQSSTPDRSATITGGARRNDGRTRLQECSGCLEDTSQGRIASAPPHCAENQSAGFMPSAQLLPQLSPSSLPCGAGTTDCPSPGAAGKSRGGVAAGVVAG